MKCQRPNELAELTNTTIVFNDKKTGKAIVEFDKNDLSNKE